MRRFWIRAAVACAVLIVPAGVLAQPTLTGTGGFTWDIDGSNTGTIVNGTIDAYDGMYSLSVNGTMYSAASTAPSIDAGGRRVTMAGRSIAGLTVSRRIYVPPTTTWWGDATSGFVRYEDILANASSAAITATVVISGNLGSDGSTERTGSSSGDVVLDGNDDWFATDDADGSLDPSLAHVMQGSGAPSRATFSMSGDTMTWTFTVTIPAGATRRIVYFPVQTNDRAAAENMAERLRLWSIPDQWDQMSSAEVGQIVNWQFATGFTVNNTVGGQLFDVVQESGALSDGTSDSYDGMYYAHVNGTQYLAGGMPALQLEGGRLITLAPATIGTLRVQRVWWVAADGDPIARASVIVHNPTAAGVAATTRIWGNLGSDGSTVTVTSSDGDATVEGTDFWAITDDVDGSGDATLVHVLDDASGPGTFSLSVDNMEWSYPATTVGAGDARIWTFFAGQTTNQAAARTLADRTRLTGQYVYVAPFAQPQNMAAWPPAWSSRSTTFDMRYAALLAADGHPYDIHVRDGGQLDNGLSDAYDGMYYLDVGATRVNYETSFGITRYSAGGGFVLPAITVGAGGLFVQRRYFVPAGAGTGFVRFYNLFGNPSLGTVTPNITMSGNLGSDGATVVSGTSDGDALVEPTDSWYGTDDTDGTGDPSLTHVARRNAASTVAESVDVAGLVGDTLSWTYNAVNIGAGGQLALMMFGVQAANRATAASRADALDDLLGEATSGLTAAEVALALNFSSALLPNGSVCAVGSQCASTFCVDTVCCNSACGGGSTGDCQACSVAAGAAANGTCGALSAAIAPSVTCRGSAGLCDVAETCTSLSTSCPADGFAAGAICRDSAGPCDLPETCTGGAAACPSDTFAAGGTSCRASAGPCDVPETCTGGGAACPTDGFAAGGLSCRPAGGACDVAEVCSGASATCPSDGRAPVGTPCRVASGACDLAEACNGADLDCPLDLVAAAGTGCRAVAGACDVAEACDGVTGACPPDALVVAGTVCRSGGIDACDPAEACDGSSVSCPEDTVLAEGASCADAAACDGDEVCTGGVCAPGTLPDCDDGDDCTADSCAEPGGCESTPIPDCCTFDGDCDDGDDCTLDGCEGDVCSFTPIAGCVAADGGLTPDGGGLSPDGGGLDADGGPGVRDGGPTRIPSTSPGCGCSIPARAPGFPAGLLLGLAVVGLFAFRRLRRRTGP